VLDTRFAREGAAVQEIPLLDGPIVRQPLLVLLDLAPDFGAQIDLAQCGIGAQPDHELIPEIRGRRGLVGPTYQFGAACGKHAVFPLAGFSGIGRGTRFDPARRLHACQFTVDLLVRGVPEIADGFVETPCQVVA